MTVRNPRHPAGGAPSYGAAVGRTGLVVAAAVLLLAGCGGDGSAGTSGGALAYGTTSVVGRMSCLSRLTGMTCWSGRSGHGFRLARAAYQLH